MEVQVFTWAFFYVQPRLSSSVMQIFLDQGDFLGEMKKCKIIDILEYQSFKVTPGISDI